MVLNGRGKFVLERREFDLYSVTDERTLENQYREHKCIIYVKFIK
jgi:hypothetical protein